MKRVLFLTTTLIIIFFGKTFSFEIEKIATIKMGGDFLFSMAISNDGKMLATTGCFDLFTDGLEGCYPNYLKAYNILNGKLQIKNEIRYSNSQVMAQAIEFSPDNMFISVGCNNGSIQILDSNDLSLIKIINALQYHIKSFKFSNDGLFLITANSSGIKIWDLKNLEVVKSFNIYNGYSTFSLNDKTFALCCKYEYKGNQSWIEFWDTEKWTLVKKIKNLSNLNGTIDISSDSKYLLYNGKKSIKVYNLETSKLFTEIKFDKKFNLSSAKFLKNNKIFAIYNNKTTTFWDLNTKSLIKTIDGKYAVYSIKADMFATVGYYKRYITIWKIKNY